MLQIPSLTPAQQRELRRWQHGSDFHLARRAQFVLWSARGWSVPALACTMGCCRRTVRRWLHAFLDAGLAGLLGSRRKLGRAGKGHSPIPPSCWTRPRLETAWYLSCPSRCSNSGGSSLSTG